MFKSVVTCLPELFRMMWVRTLCLWSAKLGRLPLLNVLVAADAWVEVVVRCRPRWPTAAALTMAPFEMAVCTVLTNCLVPSPPRRNLSVLVLSTVTVQVLALHEASLTTCALGTLRTTMCAARTLLSLGTCMLTRTMLGPVRRVACTVALLLAVAVTMSTLGRVLMTCVNLLRTNARPLISTMCTSCALLVPATASTVASSVCAC